MEPCPVILKFDGLWENEMTLKQSEREIETEWIKLPHMAVIYPILFFVVSLAWARLSSLLSFVIFLPVNPC